MKASNGILAIALMGWLAWGSSVPAMAQVVYYGEIRYDVPPPVAPIRPTQDFQVNLEIAPNMTGQFGFPGLDPGDRVVVQLSNPGVFPLVFQTANQKGTQNKWVIPAKSFKVVQFIYDPVSLAGDEEVIYAVIDPQSSLVSEDVIAALNVDADGEVHYKRQSLNVGQGYMYISQLEQGDSVVLSLYNPTQWTILFSPLDEQINQPLLIPERSHRTVSYYFPNEPEFGDKFRYEVSLVRLDTRGTNQFMDTFTPSW